jgi:hypothetical protein
MLYSSPAAEGAEFNPDTSVDSDNATAPLAPQNGFGLLNLHDNPSPVRDRACWY